MNSGPRLCRCTLSSQRKPDFAGSRGISGFYDAQVGSPGMRDTWVLWVLEGAGPGLHSQGFRPTPPITETPVLANALSTPPHGPHLRVNTSGPKPVQGQDCRGTDREANWTCTGSKSRSLPQDRLVGNLVQPVKVQGYSNPNVWTVRSVVPPAPARWPRFVPGDLYPVNYPSEVKGK